MVRRLARSSVQLLPWLVYTLLATGCGGSAGIDVAPVATPAPPGPQISGTVFAPPGTLLARHETSAFQYLASLLDGEALALTSNAKAVGRGVQVTLGWYEISGVFNEDVTQASTNDQGQYQLRLPANTTQDTSRFVVSAGAGADLTRAFVTSYAPNDIDFASETVVALILANGSNLANFSSIEIHNLEEAVRQLPGGVSGRTPGELNAAALELASADPGITAMVDEAAGTAPASTP